MCLGIPMQVLETDGFTALCAGRGEERRVNVMLIEEVPPGGWLLVHLDNAVRALEEEEEVKPLNDALDAILLAARGENVDHLFADLATPSGTPA
ncbi:HypC/HybG/HupF family hydrogenase formation chaperone [Azospirillum rugosum]|uniref:Hydrogenase expression/formation protein HypC n=1 Tax=Azospirillum rugosum TaxID=416170 RepID=A0ABS4SIY8_9PROT|nr:HypC/HybG/HupF family hydrogenase formation chaperone [Azospirillum rugosum]MBP2292524.1 hydrogenase expression/formation protein HypC [Azospirillum rugosum]MDQ0526452.1 hydrogenase expression/formation protein HypC [Azospirillum rugosum]